MAFIKKISSLNEAILSKKDFKKNPKYIDTVADSFDIKKYKGIRKNILRPLFKKIAEHYSVQLLNNGKTLVFDFQTLKADKDIIASRQLTTNQRVKLTNLLFKYNYEFNDSLFLVGNVRDKNGKVNSLIKVFDKIKKEISGYQKHQDNLDKNLIKKNKIENEIENIDKDKKFVSKTKEEKEKIIESKKESLEKIEEIISTLAKKTEGLRKDEELYNELQDKIYQYNDINYKILITYIPWRVASMSTFTASGDRPWSSCMNLDSGVNRHYVGSSMSNGAFVAYLIRPGDEENIDNPLSRVLIKPFVKIDPEDEKDYDEEDEYGEEGEDHVEPEMDADQYVEIDHLDANIFDKIFWYVDLVYPRGSYPLFRSKVVKIFEFMNKQTHAGVFVISKGQYPDSKEKIVLDDIFQYVNKGDYSDLKDRDSQFLTKIATRYPFEFFSNWPENEKIPDNLTIRTDIDLSNFDIRKIPEGLKIHGNLTIDNLNIRKIKDVKCSVLIVKNCNNLVSIEDCSLNILKIENNENLNSIENNSISKEIKIINCEKINKLDNFELTYLTIKTKKINNNFVFGKNLKTKELTLNNFQIKKIPFHLKCLELTLENVKTNTLSGDYDEVKIDSECEINEIKNLNAKYELKIGEKANINILENIFIESSSIIKNKYIKKIKNLKVKENYVKTVRATTGTIIHCENIESIENIYVDNFLTLHELKKVILIKNINSTEIDLEKCELKDKDLSSFYAKTISIKESQLKNIDNQKENSFEELIIYKSTIDKISNLNLRKIDIGNSNIKELSNLIVEDIINVDVSIIDRYVNIKSDNLYLTKAKMSDFNLSTLEINKIYLSKCDIDNLQNINCENLYIKTNSNIGMISNSYIKNKFEINKYADMKIGKNVKIGEYDLKKESAYVLNDLDIKNISPDFVINGDVRWRNSDVKIFPKMIIKGKLNLYSDSIEDIADGAEIDYFDFYGDEKMFKNEKLDKNKIIKKIKTLEKAK